jgi:hypothetical protein
VNSDHIVRYRDIGGSLDGQNVANDTAESEATDGCAEKGGESARGTVCRHRFDKSYGAAEVKVTKTLNQGASGQETTGGGS